MLECSDDMVSSFHHSEWHKREQSGSHNVFYVLALEVSTLQTRRGHKISENVYQGEEGKEGLAQPQGVLGAGEGWGLRTVEGQVGTSVKTS